MHFFLYFFFVSFVLYCWRPRWAIDVVNVTFFSVFWIVCWFFVTFWFPWQNGEVRFATYNLQRCPISKREETVFFFLLGLFSLCSFFVYYSNNSLITSHLLFVWRVQIYFFSQTDNKWMDITGYYCLNDIIIMYDIAQVYIRQIELNAFEMDLKFLGGWRSELDNYKLSYF